MAQKVINKNFPWPNALGQMNYSNGILLGMSDMGDLYTLTDELDSNEDNILLYPDGILGGNLWMYQDSSIEVVSGYINYTGVNYSVKSSFFAVYLVDDEIRPDVVDGSGNTIRDSVIQTGNDIGDINNGLLYHKDRGHLEQIDIGEITDGPDNNGNNQMKVSNIPGAPDDAPTHDGVTFPLISADMDQFSLDISSESDSSYYVIVRCGGNADDADTQDKRNRSYTKFKLPKRLLHDMWLKGRDYRNGKSGDGENYEVFYWGSKSESDTVGADGHIITTKLGGDPGYSTDNYGVGDETFDVTATAYHCNELAIKVVPPAYDIVNAPEELSDGTRAYFWVDTNDDSNHIDLRPDNLIDYTNVIVDDITKDLLQPDDIFDFRPISNVEVESPTGDVDIQSYYDFGTNGFIYGAAPNNVNLSFSISQNIKASTFTLNYYVYDEANNDWKLSPTLRSVPNIGFKFFVIDWDASDDDLEWESIINDLPTTYTELIDARNIYDTYRYVDLVNEDGSYNSLEHQYEYPGMKIIKALVFSYIVNSEEDTGDFIQALRWKAASVRVNLNYDTNILEDFSSIGGQDFTYIPWPYTTSIIGGISNESGYVNSTENILSENKFDETELEDYFRTLTAYNNRPGGALDELGDYFGKSDIAQVRYFNTGSFDMNSLLEISNQITDAADPSLFNSYDDFDYWQGDPCLLNNNYICTNFPTYPKNSSIGTIFINDIEGITPSRATALKDKCILELNADELEGDIISDSNGNDIKGILMGDYNLKKSNYGIEIARTSSPVIPEVENEDGAF